MPLSIGDVHRDVETLNEDLESEFNADIDSSDNRGVSPNLNALDSGNENYRFTTGMCFCSRNYSFTNNFG